MKTIAMIVLLGCGGTGLVYGQSPNLAPSQPVPKPAPGFGGLFQFPAMPKGSKPQFKLQIPGNDGQAFALPGPPVIAAPRQQVPVDPGMVHKPKGFAQRQPRPAQPHNIYPDLNVLPIEMARVEAPGELGTQFRMEPIPRMWPEARIEPIPTTWQGYRIVPVTTAADGKTAKK
jgi:hypothetical protein